MNRLGISVHSGGGGVVCLDLDDLEFRVGRFSARVLIHPKIRRFVFPYCEEIGGGVPATLRDASLCARPDWHLTTHLMRVNSSPRRVYVSSESVRLVNLLQIHLKLAVK